MFFRLNRLLGRVVLTCGYLYCLLLVYRLYDSQKESLERSKTLQLEFQDRAARVEAECIANPPPLTRLEMNAQRAAQVSSDMAAHYRRLHLKEAFTNVLYLPSYNLTWCLVPKVASTTWSQALLELKGMGGNAVLDTPLQVILRRAVKNMDLERVNQTITTTTTKFLFVRHPFERLVSAFRNKLENSYAREDGAYFYKTYGKFIVAKFRRNWNSGISSERGTSKEVISLHGGNATDERKLRVEMGERKGANSVDMEVAPGREPTFPEFVDYLLHTDPADYDEHWRPIALHCHACQFHFDYIIKYENFKEEIKYLIETLQQDGRLPQDFHLTWENRGGTDKTTAATYLDQVGEEQVWRLYYKYRLDFRYFGYSIKGYTSSSRADK